MMKLLSRAYTFLLIGVFLLFSAGLQGVHKSEMVDGMEDLFDFVYPSNYFFKIEAIAKELYTDLDDLMLSQDKITLCLRESPYLQEQFTKLAQAAQDFKMSAEELTFYLPEDIAYLLGVMDFLEEKYLQVSGALKHCADNAARDIHMQLLATRQALEYVLMSNEEVSLVTA